MTLTPETLPVQADIWRANNQKIVFTNGCFDILHAGHIALLQHAATLGDVLVVGLNSDASVKRLKGEARPIHDCNARAQVLMSLRCVDAVTVFEDDTPIETIRALRPDLHVKGGDYDAENLPETPVVRAGGGEVVIVPTVEGFSSTRALEKSRPTAHVIIPARYGSTRFPGKPLAILDGKTVVRRVVEAALQSKAVRPILVATDDEQIAQEIRANFDAAEAAPIMTRADCHTGTDRLAQVARAHFGGETRRIIINVQGDEPFIDPAHIDQLIDLMARETDLQMATLVTPLDEAQTDDPNVVKAVVSGRGRALYFSRAAVPFDREGTNPPRLRHLGVYAYETKWLLEMAALPPSRLEEIEKLEQLRALEAGVEIGVVKVENVVPIAIDTPEDLARATEFLKRLNSVYLDIINGDGDETAAAQFLKDY